MYEFGYTFDALTQLYQVVIHFKHQLGGQVAGSVMRTHNLLTIPRELANTSLLFRRQFIKSLIENRLLELDSLYYRDANDEVEDAMAQVNELLLRWHGHPDTPQYITPLTWFAEGACRSGDFVVSASPEPNLVFTDYAKGTQLIIRIHNLRPYDWVSEWLSRIPKAYRRVDAN